MNKQIQTVLLFGFLGALSMAGCNGPAPQSLQKAQPSVEEAVHFIEQAETQLKETWGERDRMDWVKQTYITDDTDALAAKATEKVMALQTQLIEEARRFEGLALPEEVARKFNLLKLASSLPAPNDVLERRELAQLSTELDSMYGKGNFCLNGDKECMTIGEATQVLATSRDFSKLGQVWLGWHSIAKPMQKKYQRLVELANKGASTIGYSNLSELWRANYDMTPAEFEAETERLWAQVQPFYQSLHCYVRQKLAKFYGENNVPRTGAIPAQVLGNMWSQEWGNIYPIVEPYPGQASLDVNAALKQKYDVQKMMKAGETFFTSLGMPSLPETFWQRSLMVKPKDREVVCHASAWDVAMSGDVRVKMCTEVNEDDLQTIHHELGHIYYYLAYGKLAPLFQSGAHDGFHEGIGDTLVLSMTPSYLEKLGLLQAGPENTKATINTLMKRALDKVAFLPFGKLIDQWRWQVFDGRVQPQDYSKAWWKLREKYQGIARPGPLQSDDFDPGAKYHVPANVPYTRYFLAHILQFQFHRALCRAAGHQGPLHTCSIYQNKAAGEKLWAMLQMGASKPWPEALKALSGEDKMDANALAEYFAPLQSFLDEANKGEKCGW